MLDGVAVAVVGEVGLLERDGIALITHGRYVSAAISATVATAVAIVVPTGDGALRDQVFAIVGIVAVGVDEIGLAADCRREPGAVAVPPAVAPEGRSKCALKFNFQRTASVEHPRLHLFTDENHSKMVNANSRFVLQNIRRTSTTIRPTLANTVNNKLEGSGTATGLLH